MKYRLQACGCMRIGVLLSLADARRPALYLERDLMAARNGKYIAIKISSSPVVVSGISFQRDKRHPADRYAELSSSPLHAGKRPQCKVSQHQRDKTPGRNLLGSFRPKGGKRLACLGPFVWYYHWGAPFRCTLLLHVCMQSTYINRTKETLRA